MSELGRSFTIARLPCLTACLLGLAALGDVMARRFLCTSGVPFGVEVVFHGGSNVLLQRSLTLPSNSPTAETVYDLPRLDKRATLEERRGSQPRQLSVSIFVCVEGCGAMPYESLRDWGYRAAEDDRRITERAPPGRH